MTRYKIVKDPEFSKVYDYYKEEKFFFWKRWKELGYVIAINMEQAEEKVRALAKSGSLEKFEKVIEIDD